MGAPLTPAPTATRTHALLVLCGGVQTWVLDWRRGDISPKVGKADKAWGLLCRGAEAPPCPCHLCRGIRTERLGTLKLPKLLGGFLIPHGNRV